MHKCYTFRTSGRFSQEFLGNDTCPCPGKSATPWLSPLAPRATLHFPFQNILLFLLCSLLSSRAPRTDDTLHNYLKSQFCVSHSPPVLSCLGYFGSISTHRPKSQNREFKGNNLYITMHTQEGFVTSHKPHKMEEDGYNSV